MTTQTQLPLMLLAYLRDLARKNPVWYARFEDADLDCAHEELVELMHSAPNSEVRFFLRSGMWRSPTVWPPGRTRINDIAYWPELAHTGELFG